MTELIKVENKTVKYNNKITETKTEVYEVHGYDELLEFIKQQKEKGTRIIDFIK